MFLAAREGSCEAVKVLLSHFSNREITDHMDRLPRDIAQERMHHDIVQLLDEYNTVRSPQVHHGHHHHALSPLLCPPGAFLHGLKQPPQSAKKSRRPGAKGGAAGLHGPAGSKEGPGKARSRKLTLDMQSSLLESSVTLSPVDSLDSPRGGASNAGYITNPASPALPSPGMFHPSLSVPATPMVHGVLDGGGPFAVSLAQLGDLNEAGMPMQGHGPMTPGPGAPPGYVLNAGQLGLSLGMVNPVSVPFDWHRMPPTSQCGPQVIGLVRSLSQSPALQQQHSLLQQQMFHSSQQPLLQPTPVSAPQSLSPAHLPAIAEQQQQQLHGHNLAPLGCSTPPTPQQAPPPPAFFKQQAPPPQPGQAQAPPSQPMQAPPPQAPSSSGGGLEDYPTPPSQHSYTSTLDATPKHYIHLPNEHPYLTPSPESPEPWSSPSPQCVSDWSDSTPSPNATATQTQIPHPQDANGKMQVFA